MPMQTRCFEIDAKAPARRVIATPSMPSESQTRPCFLLGNTKTRQHFALPSQKRFSRVFTYWPERFSPAAPCKVHTPTRCFIGSLLTHGRDERFPHFENIALYIELVRPLFDLPGSRNSGPCGDPPCPVPPTDPVPACQTVCVFLPERRTLTAHNGFAAPWGVGHFA